MIHKYPINPPFAHVPGDEYRRSGTSIEQWRGGVLHDTRASVGAPLVAQELIGGQDIQAFYEELPMPGVVATLTDVAVNQATGTVYVRFSDGSEREFINFAALAAEVDTLDSNTELAKNLLMLKLVRHTPDGSNLDAMNGSSVAVDGNAAVPVQFSLTV